MYQFGTHTTYQGYIRYNCGAVLMMSLLLLAVVLCSLMTGSAGLGLTDVFLALAGKGSSKIGRAHV